MVDGGSVWYEYTMYSRTLKLRPSSGIATHFLGLLSNFPRYHETFQGIIAKVIIAKVIIWQRFLRVRNDERESSSMTTVVVGFRFDRWALCFYRSEAFFVPSILTSIISFSYLLRLILKTPTTQQQHCDQAFWGEKDCNQSQGQRCHLVKAALQVQRSCPRY